MTSRQLQEAALSEVAGSYGTTHPVYHDSASGSHSWAAWITRRRPPVPPYGSVGHPHSGQERDHISRTAHILGEEPMVILVAASSPPITRGSSSKALTASGGECANSGTPPGSTHTMLVRRKPHFGGVVDRLAAGAARGTARAVATEAAMAAARAEEAID
eukprot:scaffold7938_cov55-Phaeocystis_antarctica.AAC.1